MYGSRWVKSCCSSGFMRPVKIACATPSDLIHGDRHYVRTVIISLTSQATISVVRGGLIATGGRSPGLPNLRVKLDHATFDDLD